MPTIAQLAKLYRCQPRTISNWKRDGAPLEDPKRMRSWLASRKHIPAETRGLLASEAKANRARVAAQSPITASPEIGSPAALKRLEAAEQAAFRRYKKAVDSGDQLETKLSLAAWLDIGDSLRRYDLLVERSRRDSGELIPRAEAEQSAGNFIRWLKLAIMGTANAYAPQFAAETSPAEISRTLAPAMLEQLINTLAVLSSGKCAMRLPDWFRDAAIKPVADTLTDAAGHLREREAVLREYFAGFVKHIAEQRTKTRAKA